MFKGILSVVILVMIMVMFAATDVSATNNGNGAGIGLGNNRLPPNWFTHGEPNREFYEYMYQLFLSGQFNTGKGKPEWFAWLALNRGNGLGNGRGVKDWLCKPTSATNTPAPETLILFCSGLIGLAGISRRKQFGS